MRVFQQLTAEIGRLQLISQVTTTEGRPRKYYYSDKTDEVEAEAENTGTSSNGAGGIYTEHDLYPMLSAYLWDKHKIYPLRINEKLSAKYGPQGNHWLHPDLVGLQDLGAGWLPEIKACVQQIAAQKTRLWSFEVKKFINRANVPKVYFQAVSNSSWANFGYLVAAEIMEGAGDELRMLAAMHGIGLIELDVENPAESVITIPARERADVDWNGADRLAKANPDFLRCAKLVRQFYQTGELRQQDWNIPDDQEIV